MIVPLQKNLYEGKLEEQIQIQGGHHEEQGK